MRRKMPHPASWMDLFRPALAAAPLGWWPPLPSGRGRGRPSCWSASVPIRVRCPDLLQLRVLAVERHPVTAPAPRLASLAHEAGTPDNIGDLRQHADRPGAGHVVAAEFAHGLLDGGSA